MVNKINISGFGCSCVPFTGASTVTYLLYPALVPFADEWLEKMSMRHKVSVIAVYVPGEKWNDVLTPWPEPPEAKGFPPFAGEAANFLKLLSETIMPGAEKACGITGVASRDLIGVSLAGLFTLWQWIGSELFMNIASLSGSFWYKGFITWFQQQKLSPKPGKAYFLLGDQEPKAKIEAYRTVGTNTQIIVDELRKAGVDTIFQWVPGNHFSRPVHRAEHAFEALYGETKNI